MIGNHSTLVNLEMKCIYVLLTTAGAIPSYTRPSVLSTVLPKATVNNSVHFTARLARTYTSKQKMNKNVTKSFYMYIYVHDRVQRSNAVVYCVV